MAKIDDSELLIPFVSDVCCRCIHWNLELGRGCDAFPTINGIPLEIWKGENDHTTPFPGDNGIMFEVK